MSEIGLVGKKIGMTREFYKTGQSVPVTVLKVEKGRIIQLIAKYLMEQKSLIEYYFQRVKEIFLTFLKN